MELVIKIEKLIISNVWNISLFISFQHTDKKAASDAFKVASAVASSPV